MAADVQMKLEVKHEAGTNLVEAGQVFKREDPKSELPCCTHTHTHTHTHTQREYTSIQ